MTGSRKLWIFCIVLLLPFTILAQKSRTDLEKEKKETLARINEAEKILAETSNARKASIGQLNAINKQIEARESLIQSIGQEVELINSEIGEVSTIIEALENDLVNLKKEYGSMVYIAHKASAGYNRLTFLFSAETFNQFFMRLKYMEQYSDARKNQVEQIERVRDALTEQKYSLENKNTEKKELLAQQVSENQNLLDVKSKRNRLLRELRNKESELKQEIVDNRKAVEKLEGMIAELVRIEMLKAKSGSAVDLSDMRMVTTLFEENKSQLDWPVASGFVSGKFGVHPHPVYKGIMEKNDGINIQTNRDETVKAVFDGVVSKIAILPPPFYEAVLVKHGEYITVYAKLSEVFVKSGQAIRKGERIGKVLTDKDGISEVHFMVWRNNQKLDPQNWLVRK